MPFQISRGKNKRKYLTNLKMWQFEDLKMKTNLKMISLPTRFRFPPVPFSNLLFFKFSN
jgi:hypothetical protein